MTILKKLFSVFPKHQHKHAADSLRALDDAVPIIEFTPDGIILRANALFLSMNDTPMKVNTPGESVG